MLIFVIQSFATLTHKKTENKKTTNKFIFIGFFIAEILHRWSMIVQEETADICFIQQQDNITKEHLNISKLNLNPIYLLSTTKDE